MAGVVSVVRGIPYDERGLEAAAERLAFEYGWPVDYCREVVLTIIPPYLAPVADRAELDQEIATIRDERA